jgi:hypothetical protein
MTGSKFSRLLRVETITAAAAAIAFVTGFIGWGEAYHWHLLDKAPEIIIRMIRIFVPGSVNLDEGNSLTRVAALFGLISAMAGVLIFWFAATGRSIDNTWTRLGRRHHRLVLGDTEFARAIHATLKEKGARAIRVVAAAEPTQPVKAVAGVLPIGFDTPTLIAKAGVLRSDHIVVDAGTDIATLDLARRLIAATDASEASLVRTIAIRIDDARLGLRFLELVAEERRAAPRSHPLARISIFDEHAIAARYLLSNIPLFAMAAARGQTRVHALIVGGGDAGEKMLDQVFLTSVAGDLLLPRVTIIDKGADRLRQRFSARRPGVLEALAIEFIAIDIASEPLEGPDLSPNAARLQAIEAECPFTALILAEAEDTTNIANSLVVTAHRDRDLRLKAPVIGCLMRETAIATTLFPDTPPRVAADRGCHFLTLPASALGSAALGNPESHSLALALHEAYRAGEGVSKAGDQRWEALSETLRQSNIRSADHVPATLWSAGLVEADGLSPKPDRKERLKHLVEMFQSDRQSAEVYRAARIQHDRWSVDRLLDGWRYGPERDDGRRIHPLLVSFEALQQQPVEVAKDIDRVGALLQCELGKP